MKYFFKAFANYATFSGRARRKEYWFFILFNFIFAFTLAIIELIFETSILTDIYQLATLIPSIAVGVRRMHDVGKSGWFLLIPVYNLVLTCTNGDNGTNQFGIDPKSIN
jgi:uncharacterized membrane protein YhaH (DUF805 family)